MSGLYQRALHIKTQDELFDTQHGEVQFEADSGIPLDEQKEILEQIKNIVAENKIALTKDLLVIKPEKKGFTFPLIVNFIFVILTALILLGFQALFITRQKQVTIETAGNTTDQVMKEFKKESEKNLKDKEGQIQKIQEDLQKLDQEKDQIKQNFEKEISAKESEFKQTIQAEIDKERARLRDQGISVEDINKKIKELEDQKKVEFQNKLDSFKKEAEDRRIKAEQDLIKVQNEYNASLATANKEKQQMQADSLKREEDLKKQLAEKEAALSAQTTQLETEKLKAVDDLKKLSDQKAKELVVSSQLTGLYNNIMINFKEINYNEAAKNISKLKDFFNKEESFTYPAIAQRRTVDLFVISSLENLIDFEKQKVSMDTAQIVEKASMITSISGYFNEAEEAVRQRNPAKAQELYQKALDVMPAVKASYLKTIELKDSTRTTLCDGYIAEGDLFFKKGDYTKALESYTKAIKMIPQTPEAVTRMVTNLTEAGYNLAGDPASKTIDNQKAQALITQAQASFKAANYNDAIDQYIQVLTLYPRSDKIKTARDGVVNSVKKQDDALKLEKDTIIDKLNLTIKEREDTITSNTQTISDLNKTIKQNTDRITLLETNVSDRDKTVSDLTANLAKLNKIIEQMTTTAEDNKKSLAAKTTEIADYKKVLSQKNDEISRLQGAEKTLTAAKKKLEDEQLELKAQVEALKKQGTTAATSTNPALTPEQKQDLESYSQLKLAFDRIKLDYSNYVLKEDLAVKQSGTIGYLSARPLLADVFNQPLIKDLLPSLYDRLKKYESALTEDARADGSYIAVENIISIINDRENLPKIITDTKLFWQKLKTEYKNNKIMLELLDMLQEKYK